MMSASQLDEHVLAEYDLDIPDDVHAIAERFERELYNGGFSQLFANWYPVDVKLIPAALKAIDASAEALVVEKAIAAMGPTSTWQEKGLQALLNPDDPLSKGLHELNREFDKYEEHLVAQIARYALTLDENEEGDEQT